MTTPRELAIVALLAGGVFFVFVGAVGVIRLPDLYTRTHAASKSDTLGVVLSLGAATLIFENFSMRLKVLALLLFMLITNPTATHAIARAAFDQDIDPWTTDDDPSDEPVAADRDSVDDDGPTDVGVTGGGITADGASDGGATDNDASDGGTIDDEGSPDGGATGDRVVDDRTADDRTADGGAD